MKLNQTSIVTIIWKIKKWPKGVRNKIKMTDYTEDIKNFIVQ